MSGVALHFEGIGRTFPGNGSILRDFSAEIEPGSFVSLLGPSGCGKSTLLRLAAGLDRPDQGSVSTAPPPSHSQPFRGFVFQDPSLLPWRNALQNAALPLELIRSPRRVPRKDIADRARASLRRVGLDGAERKLPHELSGGMRMRVSLARALIGEPRLLLLDEPFAALDEPTRHTLQEDLRKLWEETRMTVLFVTHSLSEALYLSDQILIFRKNQAPTPFEVPFGGHREGSLRTDPAFNESLRQLQKCFRSAGGLG